MAIDTGSADADRPSVAQWHHRGRVIPIAVLVGSIVCFVACTDTPLESPGNTDVGSSDDGAISFSAQPRIVDLDAGRATDASGQDSGDDANDAVLADAPIDEPEADLPPVGPAIEVHAVTPESGSTEGGTEILVLGLNFTPTTDVFFGGELCLNIDVVDESKIICRAPPNPPGVYDVKAADDARFASLAGAFTYVAPLLIDRLEPDFGPTTGGMPVTLLGSGLTPEAQVSIGGNLALAVEWVDANSLRLLTPPGEPGRQVVQVSSLSGLDRLELGFEYLTPLIINAILPGAGDSTGGETVEVQGAGFAQSDMLSVRFGALEVDFEVIDDGLMWVETPPGPPDEWIDVTLTSDRNGVVTSANAFYYYDSPGTPSVLHVHPRVGPTSGGTEVVLSGTGLDVAEQVQFGGQSASVASIEARYLIVATPTVGSPGPVDIDISGDGIAQTVEQAFTYLKPIVVGSVEPNRGDVAGGTPIVVRGSGFNEDSRLRVGALPVSDLEVVDDDELRAVTPPGVVGPADVVVEDHDALLGRLVGGFTYTANVAAHGLSPSHGSLAGGTVVLIRGSGFIEPTEVTFDGQAALDVTLLDSATMAVRTPPSEDVAFVDVFVAVGGADPVLVPERFLYFDPLSGAGGVWGDAVSGAVNVTVIGETGAPLENAFVMLGQRPEPSYSGYTDPNGQVTLSGLGLSGPLAVSASRPGFSSSVVYDVDAENVTLVLRCAPDDVCSTDANCFTGLVCQDGRCVDPRCIGQGGSGEPTPLATITGYLSGMDKVGVRLPGERLLAAVYTTQPGAWPVMSAAPGRGEHILEEDGEFTLLSRLGSLALVAVCGYYNDETRTFRPVRMGVRRDLYTVSEEVYEIDLTCDIWLDQILTVKAVSSPLSEDGPTGFRHYPYLDFGTDGFFGGLVIMEGTDEVLSREGFAPLEGQLAGLSYTVRGGAYTGYSWPYSISYLRNQDNVDGVLTLPPFVPVAMLTTPSEVDEALLNGGYLEWEVTNDNPPDFWRVLIRDRYGVYYWEAVLPGDRMHITLPAWPTDADVGLFPAGEMLIIFRGVDALSFDIDAWDFNDFSSSAWHAYSLTGVYVTNP